VNSTLRAYLKWPQGTLLTTGGYCPDRHSVANMVLRIVASLEDDYVDSDKKELVSQKIAFVGAWAFWKAPQFRGSLSVMFRENMEILIFALIASYNAHRQQKWVVAEPEEFRAFDLQALRNSADNKPSQLWSRRVAYVPQTA
jgi:hypothetical protein